ncbi:MAG TPA: hypothetical protein VG938_13470 [Verrucomicrobiae bacterium]|jgi:hypothetical protein|nr:hypothetical protein [Verrucomicrobiae bacterium]
MSSNEPPDALAFVTAEEVLRTIYGDDLQGCQVSLDAIAGIIDPALRQTAARNSEVLELYEKVVEAVHLLSTPPDKTKVTEPNDLQALLTERLDAIHAVSSKTIETLAIVRGKKNPESGGTSSASP